MLLNLPLNKDAALAKMLKLSGSEIHLKNIWVHTQKEDILRIFFQTEPGKAYMLVVNKTDFWAQDISLKGIHELSPEVAQTYLNRYTQLKQEILTQN